MKQYRMCSSNNSQDTVKACILICQDEISNVTTSWSSNLSSNQEKHLYRVNSHIAVIYGITAINGKVHCDHSELNEIAATSLHERYITIQLYVYQDSRGDVVVSPDKLDNPEITDVLKQYFK